MKKQNLILTALLVVFVFGFYFTTHRNNEPSNPQTNTATQTPQNQILGQQTKSSNCQTEEALPDKECTPGAIFETATKREVCTPGYSASVRDVSAETKKEVYEEYGIYHHNRGEYEVDHFISLELGGSNDVSNLWPESAEPRPGYHEKDEVENYLHDQLCSGKISLSQAQTLISGNWVEVYKKIKQ